MKVLKLGIIMILFSALSNQTDFDEEDVSQTIDQLPITCSSTIRLQNLKLTYFLHSQDIQYGSGSGQQAVTGYDNDHDYNSLWAIKEADTLQDNNIDPIPPCRTGTPIKCNQYIRLEHMYTGKNLHSHQSFDSPVSGRQEVSAYGNDGYGDGGDNWQIECESDDVNGIVYGKTKFYLRHIDSGMYLYTDNQSKYNNMNCRRCPIIGQSEISCAKGKTKSAIWKVHSGFFFPIVNDEPTNFDF